MHASEVWFEAQAGDGDGEGSFWFRHNFKPIIEPHITPIKKTTNPQEYGPRLRAEFQVDIPLNLVRK